MGNMPEKAGTYKLQDLKLLQIYPRSFLEMTHRHAPEYYL